MHNVGLLQLKVVFLTQIFKAVNRCSTSYITGDCLNYHWTFMLDGSTIQLYMIDSFVYYTDRVIVTLCSVFKLSSESNNNPARKDFSVSVDLWHKTFTSDACLVTCGTFNL